MDIEYIFDASCPWCFLGKRKLDKVLQLRRLAGARLSWKPFLLNPDLPTEGLDWSAYLSDRFGSQVRANLFFESMSSLGKEFNIQFNFDLIGSLPNTRLAHTLIRFVCRNDETEKVIEELFNAYFNKGIDIGNINEIYEIAKKLDLDCNEFKHYLFEQNDSSEVRLQNTLFYKFGIRGVPAIVIDGQYVISGAQDPQVIVKLLEVAGETRRELFTTGTQPL